MHNSSRLSERGFSPVHIMHYCSSYNHLGVLFARHSSGFVLSLAHFQGWVSYAKPGMIVLLWTEYIVCRCWLGHLTCTLKDTNLWRILILEFALLTRYSVLSSHVSLLLITTPSNLAWLTISITSPSIWIWLVNWYSLQKLNIIALLFFLLSSILLLLVHSLIWVICCWVFKFSFGITKPFVGTFDGTWDLKL